MNVLTERKMKSESFEWIMSFMIAIIAGLVIKFFLFTPIVVDGQSMKSTLNDQDRMIVSKLSKPERFDIVVFHANEKQDYIKRVIGLPGDKIEYENDTLYINGKAYEEEYLEENKKWIKEQFGEDALLTDNFTLEDLWGYETVPEDTIFVLGDNRRFSKDSRHIGVIPMKAIIGDAKIVIWPIKNAKIIR